MDASPHRTGDAPCLRVTAPGDRLPERRYVLDVVLSEWLGLTYRLEPSDSRETEITLEGDSETRRLLLPDSLLSAAESDWLTAGSIPDPPLAVASPGVVEPERRPGSGRIPESLPVLFGRPDPEGLAWREVPDGLAFSIDVFGTIFFLLTRYEEIAKPIRDEHGRYPASASLASRAGFIDRPLADEYADLLWYAMRSLWPHLARPAAIFRLCLTHDVDLAFATHGRSTRSIARALAADVLSRRDIDLAWRRFRAAVDARSGNVDRDPFNTYRFLMDVSESHNARSTFYFMARGGPSEFGSGYLLTDPKIEAVLRAIHERGHAIGLHGSYASHMSIERLRAESEALDAACDKIAPGSNDHGVRQHFLRFQAPETWRIQEAVGLEYDSTLAFADQAGFRAGTSREFPVFDLLERRPLTLRERPLVIMDRTLFDYSGLDADKALSTALRVVERCREHGGSAVVLYHNSFVAGSRRAEHYRRLVAAITSTQSTS